MAWCSFPGVAGNTFICPGNVGLVALRPYRDEDGVPDTRDIRITGNVFQVGSAKAIRVSGVKGLSLRANRCVKDGRAVKDPSEYTIISGCDDVVLEPPGLPGPVMPRTTRSASMISER